MSQQVKSKKRVAAHGEVFTAEREVKAMCDLVQSETERIDARFLEPACGNGNFLAEILQRKLKQVSKRYKKSSYDWERNALLTLGSLYGVDLLLDNCLECRQRLFQLWDQEYQFICKKDCHPQTRRTAKFILSRNIVCGNALTLNQVDEHGQDLPWPIVFSEWAFPFNDTRLQRSDYTLAQLLAPEKTDSALPAKKRPARQLTLAFIDEVESDKDTEGVFLQKYITHYRKIKTYESN